MIFTARRTAIAFVCVLPMLSVAAVRTEAQTGAAGACQVSLLALVVASQADPQDNAQYRGAASAVLETCGAAAGASNPAKAAAAFDVAACGKLAQSMLGSIEEGKMGSPPFVEARDQFAGQCRGG